MFLIVFLLVGTNVSKFSLFLTILQLSFWGCLFVYSSDSFSLAALSKRNRIELHLQVIHVTLNFPLATLENIKRKLMKLILIKYFNPTYPIYPFQHITNLKINEVSDYFFHTQSLNLIWISQFGSATFQVLRRPTWLLMTVMDSVALELIFRNGTMDHRICHLQPYLIL